jgi:hypothetical protein
MNFDWLLFTPLWSPSSVLQLVSELVWSLVGFNMLCDSKATWRKVLLSFGLQWRGFRLLETPNSQLSLEPGLGHLGDRLGGVCDPGYTRPRDPR